MNDYQRYMDSVTMPDTLRKKLTGLKAPKRAAPWRRYGAMAAAAALPEDRYERTVVWDTEVTALKDSGYVILEDGTELRESREVSLLANGVGCKFIVHCADGEQAERLCSRLVRFAILEGFDLSALDSAGAVSE